MRTNRKARARARLRLPLTLLALIGCLGFEVWSGASLAGRLGQTTGRNREAAPPPDVNLGALVEAAR